MKGSLIFFILLGIAMAAQYTEHCNKIISSFPQDYTMTGGITSVKYDIGADNNTKNIRYIQAKIRESSIKQQHKNMHFIEISTNQGMTPITF